VTPRRRVAVTGLGVVSPCGIGADAFWQGLLDAPPEGERRVHDWDPSPWYDNPKEARRTDRFAQFAMAAAEMAREAAGEPSAPHDRRGVVIGTGVGGLETVEEQIIVHHEKGPRRVSPFLVPMMMPNAGAANVSMRFGWQGPCETPVTACAAGTHAVSRAAELIALGRCDAVLTGGSEAAMTPTGIQGFRNMTALSSSGHSRPFDVRRDGFMIAEGGAVLQLELWEHAEERGATILAEVLGSAASADAHHITAPAPGGSGAAHCMRLALEDAGLTPDEIAHVNAHGTSTPLNDAAEAEAMMTVFGDRSPIVTSTKGVTGHALGAAGALEAVAVVLSMTNRLVPPTAGHEQPDPELPKLDLVVGEAREWAPGPSLSNSFGFGGHNGTLVIGPA
jgi:3-oxoacyl-[acyl-carrier-protein] synthase II